METNEKIMDLPTEELSGWGVLPLVLLAMLIGFVLGL